jgi:methanogenic corrinoid protein MtbC1
MSFLRGMLEKEPPEPENPIGIVVIGNLEGDRVHATARDMVRRELKKAQFKTINLGINVAADVFASTAKEVNADIVAVSCNTTESKISLPKLIAAIESEKLKDQVIVMVGGAAVKKEDADKIGALYGKNKKEAVKIAQKAIEEKKAKQ